jgi:hypothetical protein
MDAISPWTIYWVMQLDSIGMAAGFLSFAGAFGLVGLWVFVVTEADSLAGYLAASAATLVWLVVLTAAIFLPSTRTAAAMFVIPAVANNQTIQREAGELYDLAKQALRKAGDIKPDAKAADEEAR